MTSILTNRNNEELSTWNYESINIPFKIDSTVDQTLVSNFVVRNAVQAVRNRIKKYNSNICESFNDQRRRVGNDACVYDAYRCEYCNEHNSDDWKCTRVTSYACYEVNCSICNASRVVYIQQPRVISLLEIQLPQIQFIIPSSVDTRLC
eukprot:PhF_6_TR15455/c1_g1_i1/m.24015